LTIRSVAEELQLRIHGDPALPTLIYLPGLHGDWTLVTNFRRAVAGRVRFVEITYPRSLTWSLEDYAKGVTDALAANSINQGWLLAESFSSQVAWPLLEGCRDGFGTSFQPDGLILAGGFVRHPFNRATRMAGRIFNGVSLLWFTRLLFGFARIVRYLHRHEPARLASLEEFLARRTELDIQAGAHRLQLIADHDPCSTARQTAVPVCALTGLFDPIVPWPLILPWLKRNCPDYRGQKIIWNADHAVLVTAPREAAEQIVKWMGMNPRRSQLPGRNC
jgi:pimeloyl-ACP methyl ester carboxylesterase